MEAKPEPSVGSASSSPVTRSNEQCAGFSHELHSAKLDEDVSNNSASFAGNIWDSLGKLDRVVSWADESCGDGSSSPWLPASNQQVSEHGSDSTATSESVGRLNGATTVMIRNIPTKCTQKIFVTHIHNHGFAGRYTFLNFPLDPRTRVNRGFAFVDLETAETAREFYDTFHGSKFSQCSSSEKLLQVAVADVQGFYANAKHFLASKTTRRNRDALSRPIFLRALPADLAKLYDDAAIPVTSTHGESDVDGHGASTPVAQKHFASSALAPPLPRFCMFCGNRRNGDHMFCPYCGANFSKAPAALGRCMPSPAQQSAGTSTAAPTWFRAGFSAGQWVMYVPPSCGA